MYKTIALVVIFVTLNLQHIFAVTTCAAQANFDKCKEIQSTLLSTCAPIDYACQCKAQQLIFDCFALCTNYASEASIQSGTVKGICSVVSSSSSLLVPSSTATSLVLKSTTNIPSSTSSSSVKQSSKSLATHVYPTLILVITCTFVALI